MDFNFITARLATGAAIGSMLDVNALLAAGINAIVDCRDDFDDGPLLAGNPGIAYLWNPTADDGQVKPASWFGRSINFTLPLISKSNTKFLFHCAAGVNRGPSTLFVILRSLGFSHQQAHDLIVAARPVCANGIRYADDADRAITALGYG